MKSRGAILHEVGGPWSVEDFEPDPPGMTSQLTHSVKIDLQDFVLDDVNDAYDDLRNGKIVRGIIDFGIE